MVAGPGAGKTRVLTHAIAHRIGAGLPPERCLAVTFTRRARDELRDRLAALLGADAAARVTVATFHGLGLLILREQCKRLGLDAGLKVADERTRQEVLRSLSAGSGPAALGARISSSKRARAPRLTDAPPRRPWPTRTPRSPRDTTRRSGSAAWSTWTTWSRCRPSCSARTPRWPQAYRSRWTDVFVDEYQDVDEQQYRLLRLLTSGDSRVCVIGDPDQAIYGFRGGDVGYFLRFAADFRPRRRCGCRGATGRRRRSCGPLCS